MNLALEFTPLHSDLDWFEYLTGVEGDFKLLDKNVIVYSMNLKFSHVLPYTPLHLTLRQAHSKPVTQSLIPKTYSQLVTQSLILVSFQSNKLNVPCHVAI